MRPWHAPLEIPDCPEGWTTGPPDYMGIGAQRCGTSWWYDAMRRHPAIERSPLGKEVHYFDRFWQGDAPDDIAAEYASLFPRPPGKVVGEWTPRYLADFWTAPLIRKAAPDARLLVMLRDPVARYRSAIARLHRMAEERGDPVLLASVSDATWRGFYYQQLRHVFDFFPREQVLVLQFERCVAGPDGGDGAHLAVSRPGAAAEGPRIGCSSTSRPAASTPELEPAGEPRSSPSATGRTPAARRALPGDRPLAVDERRRREASSPRRPGAALVRRRAQPAMV